MAQFLSIERRVFLLRRWKIMRTSSSGISGRSRTTKLYSNSFFRSATLRSSKERPANVGFSSSNSKSPVIKESTVRILCCPSTNTCFWLPRDLFNPACRSPEWGIQAECVDERTLLSDRPNRIRLKRRSNLEVASIKGLLKPNGRPVRRYSENFCIAPLSE